MHAAQRLGSKLAVLARRKQFLKWTHTTCDNARIGQRQLAYRLGHERDNLDIARGIARTDKLKAQLCKLARASGVALALTNHRRLVTKAQGQVGRAHAGRNQAHDRQRVVGTDHQHAAIIVKEFKRRVRNAAAFLERAFVLEQRRLDRQVTMLPEAALHRQRNLLARLSLLGQYIPESPRCGCHTCAHLLCRFFPPN